MPNTSQYKNVSSTHQEIKPLFIRRSQIKQITGLSNSTCWRLETEGLFPKRRKIGHGCVGWLYSEVLDFMNSSEVVE